VPQAAAKFVNRRRMFSVGSQPLQDNAQPKKHTNICLYRSNQSLQQMGVGDYLHRSLKFCGGHGNTKVFHQGLKLSLGDR
jgi:hypothetical protein